MTKISKILVTGATGLIGSGLVKALASEGHEVRCLVFENLKNFEFFKNLRVEIVYGDVTDINSINGICKDVDTVIHCVAVGDINAVSKKHYEQCRKVIVDGTRNLLKECLKFRVKRFIYFSSIAVYGIIDDKKKITLETKKIPKTPYEIIKLEAEKICFRYCKDRIQLAIIRPCTVYDFSTDDSVGIGSELKLLIKMVKMGFVFIPGNGQSLINLIHRKKVIKRILHLLKKKNIDGVYLFLDEILTTNQLVDKIAKYHNIKNYYIIHLHPLLLLPFIFVLEELSKIFHFVPIFRTDRLLYIYRKYQKETIVN